MLPESGNTSFPGETKLLLYHSGPQVFQCSVTISCERRGKETFTDANLSPPHTNALCKAGAFSKGSRVPYHRFCSQLACNSSLHRLMYQTNNETLFVCFYDIESRPQFAIAAVGLERMVPTKIRGLMCCICRDDHQSSEHNRSIWESTHDSE